MAINRTTNLYGARLLTLLMLAALLSMGLVTAAPAAVNAQPALVALARSNPEQQVQVIVQQTSGGAADAAVAALGGVVTRQLGVINAVVARLSARAAVTLSATSGVRWVSLDTPVTDSGKSAPCPECVDTTQLKNAYNGNLGVDRLWNEPARLQGQGITVAVVDSGVNTTKDIASSRIVFSENFNTGSSNSKDKFGHGTHVAGIIGGDGTSSDGAYIGIAPKVNLISLKVSDDQGGGLTSDVVNALAWIYDHKDDYNIRVVNLSLNSSVNESYHENPIAAAAEVLWFNSIVVVVSAGNDGSALYPPANDPFVISVGAVNDKGTLDTGDDVLASYSGYGTTIDGMAKPELVAPGSNIISVLPNSSTTLGKDHADHVVDKRYFRMSGTSMSAPMVTGVVALMLQDEPSLTPDQVKYRLMATARPFAGATAGYVDAYAAVHGATTESANTGTQLSQLLTGTDGTPESKSWNSKSWNSKSWNSKSWNSKSWNSKSWNSKSWNSVTLNSDYWGQ